MFFVLGNKFKQAKESKDFPQPEGPTIAVVLFFLKEKEKPDKTLFSKKEIERFLISKATLFFKIK